MAYNFPSPDLTKDMGRTGYNLITPPKITGGEYSARELLREIEKYNKNHKTRIRYWIHIHDIYMPKAEDFSDDLVGYVAVTPENPIANKYGEYVKPDSWFTFSFDYRDVVVTFEGVSDKLRNQLTTMFEKKTPNEAYAEVNNLWQKLQNVFKSCSGQHDYREYIETFINDYPKVLAIEASMFSVDLETAKVKYLEWFVDTIKNMLASEENMKHFKVISWFTEEDIKNFYNTYGNLHFKNEINEGEGYKLSVNNN